MVNVSLIDSRLDALSKSNFRSKFHLKDKEREIVREKGLATIREHAQDIITKRLAPAHPYNDGKQTPFKGHPVFIAQHATATCCRTCLSKWHNVQPGRELTDEQKEYVMDVISKWFAKEL